MEQFGEDCVNVGEIWVTITLNSSEKRLQAKYTLERVSIDRVGGAHEAANNYYGFALTCCTNLISL